MSKCAIIEELEAEKLKKDLPEFAIGDTIRVHFRIIEGTKERVQVFVGTVIGRQGHGLSETVTLHRVAYGGGMERVVILHSPRVAKIEVVRKGKVRRAKLYYLRGTSGKKAKVRELILKKKKPSKEAAKPAVAEVVAEPVAEQAPEQTSGE
jgi:large subunit ribosomal protein L19